MFGPNKYLDFSKFIKLVEKKLHVSFDKIYFYASYSPKAKKPTRKEMLYIKNETFFYKSVRRSSKVFFFKGYRSRTSGKEKEVDVKLSVDVVDFAHRNYYDCVYLISGDADFMEALFAVRRLGKEIRVMCLENKIMFKSLAFFYTYIAIFMHEPILKKLTGKMQENIHRLKMDKRQIVSYL